MSAAEQNNPYTDGHIDWNGRIERAIASENSWKALAFSCLGVTLFAVGGLIYEHANKTDPTVMHVVYNKLGETIGINTSKGGQEEPSQLQFKAAIEMWIVNCRTVSMDAAVIVRDSIDCAALIEKPSQADADMKKFFNTPHENEPFVRAATETVYPEDVVAIPPTAAQVGPGPEKLQTWSVEWTERVTARDGSSESRKHWGGGVTFIYHPPKIEEIQHNPDGIRIRAYQWTQKS